nr:MAG TPA: hypothetical protein [Caudoviricetes sp.]
MLVLNALCNYGERATRLLGWASKKAARFATDGLDFRNAKKISCVTYLARTSCPRGAFSLNIQRNEMPCEPGR